MKYLIQLFMLVMLSTQAYAATWSEIIAPGVMPLAPFSSDSGMGSFTAHTFYADIASNPGKEIVTRITSQSTVDVYGSSTIGHQMAATDHLTGATIFKTAPHYLTAPSTAVAFDFTVGVATTGAGLYLVDTQYYDDGGAVETLSIQVSDATGAKLFKKVFKSNATWNLDLDACFIVDSDNDGIDEIHISSTKRVGVFRYRRDSIFNLTTGALIRDVRWTHKRL